MSEVKPWRCRQDGNHVLGQVVRNGRGVRVLLLYREAVDLSHAENAENAVIQEVDVMATVEGYVADVRCSICGGVRTWVPGEEAMQELIRQAQRRQER